MSRRYQAILIGGLIGGIIGAVIGWVYGEFSGEDTTLPGTRSGATKQGLKLQAEIGDWLKLGLAAIPVFRMMRNMFVPADRGHSLPTSQDES